METSPPGLVKKLAKGFRSPGIPILSRPARHGGNSGKLVAVKTLLRGKTMGSLTL
jgi:hypothetical protein